MANGMSEDNGEEMVKMRPNSSDGGVHGVGDGGVHAWVMVECILG